MARPLRIDTEDGWHHVMNRGADRARVFLDDTDRVEFGIRLADIHDRFGVETHGYCLLDTHFHLLLHCPQGGLSDAMQRLGSLYTRHVNDRLGRDGALFRGRFHSKPIQDDRYLLAAVRYVHRNALDVSGVHDVEQYRWSSHRAYLGRRRLVPWLRTDVVLSHFGGDRQAFHDFVRLDDVPSQSSPSRADLVAMLDAASLVVLELGLSDHGRGMSVARSVALCWADEWALYDAGTLMEMLEVPSIGALRTARSRARRRQRDDVDFARAVARSAQLAAVPVLRLGSDPWRNGHSAARAAS
jgi:REP element-mobilizing transposase RayT